MLHLFAVVLPLGFSAAVSPMMFTQQLLLVGGPGGRRTAALYLAGTVVILVAVTGLVWFVGGAVNLPAVPRLDAAADVFLGVVLLVLALVIKQRRPRASKVERGPAKAMPASAAFGFGLFSMATNFTTLPIVVVAAKEIAASGQAVTTRLAAMVLLLFLACVPAWSPVVVTAWPRGTAFLNGVRDLASRYAKEVLIGVLFAVGAFSTVRGVLRLLGV